MADLNIVIGEQAYERALSGGEILVSKKVSHRGSVSSHEPTSRDTHESNDNVIFAQFVDLGNASICHFERIVIPIRALTKLSRRCCVCKKI